VIFFGILVIRICNNHTMEIIKIESASQVFNDLAKQDERLNAFNLMQTRAFVFNDDVPVNDFITPNLSIGTDHPMFIWPPEDGFRSLARRGFYKIVSSVVEQEDVIFTKGNKYKSYWAEVIFCKKIKDEQYFRFTANIGPLVNSYAVIFDLSPTRERKVLKFPDSHYISNKMLFLQQMIGNPFYMSLQQRIEESSKQTFWFKL